MQCPLIEKTYNNGMKGIDLMDQLRISYKLDCRHLKKFYSRVFFDIIYIGYVNTYIVYTKYMKEKFSCGVCLKTLKEFKHDVVINLIWQFLSSKREKSYNSDFQILIKRG